LFAPGSLDSLDGGGCVGGVWVAQLPGHNDIECVFHPWTRLGIEGFGEVGAFDEGLECIDVEDFELGDTLKEAGI
jgi:hypothetical protein